MLLVILEQSPCLSSVPRASNAHLTSLRWKGTGGLCTCPESAGSHPDRFSLVVLIDFMTEEEELVRKPEKDKWRTGGEHLVLRPEAWEN